MVEHRLAKARVAGSNPVSRSNFRRLPHMHETGFSDRPSKTSRRLPFQLRGFIGILLTVALSGGMTTGYAQTQVDSATEGAKAISARTKPIMTVDDRSTRLKGITQNWKTDWMRHTIPYDEILSGGPPRDGIRSIDTPKFISSDLAASFLDATEPVIILNINGDARAYPIQILTWHEIVNDTVGGTPVVVTFCPLCNSAIAFDRRFDGSTHEFGTSGLLRYSDLIMYDRTTESLWQQFTGEGIVGEKAGYSLTFLPASLISFAEFREAYPQGAVLSRDTGTIRSYGNNPYKGYDTIGNTPFMFPGRLDERLPAMARVVTVSLKTVDIAYPLNILAERGIIHDVQDGRDLVVFHTSGTNSALGAARIAEGTDVGATGVFNPTVGGERLTFHRKGNDIIDQNTQSHWNIVGHAISGPLQGQRLTPIIHGDHFWFSWAAFRPDTILYSAE